MFLTVLFCLSGGLIWGIITWMFNLSAGACFVGIIGVYVLSMIAADFINKNKENS